MLCKRSVTHIPRYFSVDVYLMKNDNAKKNEQKNCLIKNNRFYQWKEACGMVCHNGIRVVVAVVAQCLVPYDVVAPVAKGNFRNSGT